MSQMDILDFVLCLIELGAIYLFFQYILNARFSGLFPTLLIAGINAVFVYFCSGLNIVDKSLIFFCFLMIGNTILYRNKNLIRTALSMLMLYIFYIIDIIFGNICSLVLDEQFLDVFYNNFIDRLVICLIIKLFDIIAIISIAKAFHKVDLNLSNRIWGMFNIAIGGCIHTYLFTVQSGRIICSCIFGHFGFIFCYEPDCNIFFHIHMFQFSTETKAIYASNELQHDGRKTCSADAKFRKTAKGAA